MGRSALPKVHPRVEQAQHPVDGQADLGRVGILLSIVLPPAHGAQLQCLRRRQGPVTAAWAAESRLHTGMDGFRRRPLTLEKAEHRKKIGGKGQENHLRNRIAAMGAIRTELTRPAKLEMQLAGIAGASPASGFFSGTFYASSYVISAISGKDFPSRQSFQIRITLFI